MVNDNVIVILDAGWNQGCGGVGMDKIFNL
jgi:hypothetical protein